MRDDDLAFVEQIHRELQGVRWASSEEIRARARRRSQRRIVVATVVLALTGASAAAVAAPGKSPAPGLPAAPTRHEIPLDALLQPADLRQQVYTQLSQSGLGEPVRLEETLGDCRTSQGLSDGWQTSNLSRSQTLMRKHSPDNLVEGDVLLMQDLFRLAPETARQLVAGLDDVVAPCARWRTVGQAEVNGTTQTTEVIHRWSVARRGFAGDDAAILRDSLTAARDVQTGQALSGEPTPLLLAVVRVGDTVSVLRPGYDGTESDLVQLAEAAAARMCAAANPAC
ncbi:hypothetical protein [Micromonospora sp. NPDC005237]|uniref:hypothetical protein n=1 Tax=Micromonospora sp. NPDC005237 TaxID=3155113 RepID=UPI0033AE76BD